MGVSRWSVRDGGAGDDSMGTRRRATVACSLLQPQSAYLGDGGLSRTGWSRGDGKDAVLAVAHAVYRDSTRGIARAGRDTVVRVRAWILPGERCCAEQSAGQ